MGAWHEQQSSAALQPCADALHPTHALKTLIFPRAQVLLSTGGGALTLLDIQAGGLAVRASATLPAEVACLDITPIGGRWLNSAEPCILFWPKLLHVCVGVQSTRPSCSAALRPPPLAPARLMCPPPPHRPPGESSESAQLAAVGTWAMEVQLLRLPDLAPAAAQPLGSEGVIPRSVLLAGFEGAHHHLLVGLGDGALHSWRLDPAGGALSGEAAAAGAAGSGAGQGLRALQGPNGWDCCACARGARACFPPPCLRGRTAPTQPPTPAPSLCRPPPPANPSDKKQIQLGTKPILLRTFTSGGVGYVFAACDRPTIIYSQNKKLIYSNLNENEVRARPGAFVQVSGCPISNFGLWVAQHAPQLLLHLRGGGSRLAY